MQIISSLNRCEQLGSFSHEGLNTLKLLKKSWNSLAVYMTFYYSSSICVYLFMTLVKSRKYLGILDNGFVFEKSHSTPAWVSIIRKHVFIIPARMEVVITYSNMVHLVPRIVSLLLYVLYAKEGVSQSECRHTVLKLYVLSAGAPGKICLSSQRTNLVTRHTHSAFLRLSYTVQS